MSIPGKQKNVLFAIGGFQPQIITQALYHFNINKRIKIEELIIISTSVAFEIYENGSEKYKLPKFLGLEGKLKEYWEEYDVTPPLLKRHAIKDYDGKIVPQIKLPNEIDASAYTIINKLRDIKVGKNDNVHCIYAGGQRVLASYLMSSLVLVGDERYRLYYIHVSESNLQESPNFFYPPKKPKMVKKLDGNSVSSSDVKISAVEIKYPRLGGKYSGIIGDDKTYQDVIDHVQEYISQEQKPVEEIYDFEESIPNIIGESPKIKSALDMIKKLAQNGMSPILLQGESGTGKELFAKYYHYWYQQKAATPVKYLTINCGAIPKDLIESELFGYKKGAHSTAFNDKIGRLSAAEGGVVFLDEINSAPLELQTKLLRFLETGEIQPLNSNDVEHVNVRVVFGCNVDIVKLVDDGLMREDFYYRIVEGMVKLPSLAERKEDIPLLIENIMQKYCNDNGRESILLSNEIIDRLTNHQWTGNVRGLKTYLEKLIIMTEEKGTITKMIVEPGQGLKEGNKLFSKSVISELIGDGQSNSHDDIMMTLEKSVLEIRFEENDRSVAKTSEAIGIKLSTLKDKLKKYSIH